MATVSELRLAGMTAFLGEIRPEVRQIGVRQDGEWIVVDVVLDREPSPDLTEDISSVGAEIVSHFPDLKIDERIAVVTGALPRKHIFEDGLIYQRWEA